jgi:hypothetical protein
MKYENRNSMIKINLDIQYNKIINMIKFFIVAVWIRVLNSAVGPPT